MYIGKKQITNCLQPHYCYPGCYTIQFKDVSPIIECKKPPFSISYWEHEEDFLSCDADEYLIIEVYGD